jgi:hypothetical protein
MKKFTADFETCTWLEDETYVWAWALCEIGGKFETIVGTNIESFFEEIDSLNNPQIYFHNLKFDRKLSHIIFISGTALNL